MLTMHIETIGDMTVIACEGRLVRSEAAFRLRDAVMSQDKAQTVVLDFTDVDAIEAGGLGMLAALQIWAQDHEIQLKLFNPRYFVKKRLESYDTARFDIATFDEMMTLLARAEGYRKAA